LTHHYPELGELPLQAPDLIDDGEHLDTIAENSLDFVVANHFFEHSENPIRTLENLLRVLKPSGVLFMAIPDKRYTFDAERPSTAFATLRSTYKTGVRPDRLELYREWVQLCEMNRTSWEDRFNCLLNENYSIHFNVWSADELLAFLIEARQEFNLPFQILSAVCSDNETIVLLERTSAPTSPKRIGQPVSPQPAALPAPPAVTTKRASVLIQVFPFNPTGYVEKDAVSARAQVECWSTLTFDLPPGALGGPIRIDPADTPCVIEIGELQVVDPATKKTLVRLREPSELHRQLRILNWATFLSASNHCLLFCSGDDPQIEFTLEGAFEGAAQLLLLMRIELNLESVSAELKALDRRAEERVESELAWIRTELRASQASRNLLATQVSQLAMEKSSALRDKNEELKDLQEKLECRATDKEDLVAQEKEMRLLQAQITAYRAALIGVENSISWRITKPMRAVMSFLRGRGNGTS
ncbi:MAG: methyltransferase domain-containing protein, partial [Acidobacteriaceae bacterium]|nr:methyltransferase domain-containing protein [Acidobacteriaceae bacterium]